jgi:hypothetical protein
MKGPKNRRTTMHSTPYHEQFAPNDGGKGARDLKSRLDEIAVFALAAAAIFYIAAAGCWFLM